MTRRRTTYPLPDGLVAVEHSKGYWIVEAGPGMVAFAGSPAALMAWVAERWPVVVP